MYNVYILHLDYILTAIIYQALPVTFC